MSKNNFNYKLSSKYDGRIYFIKTYLKNLIPKDILELILEYNYDFQSILDYIIPYDEYINPNNSDFTLYNIDILDDNTIVAGGIT